MACLPGSLQVTQTAHKWLAITTRQYSVATGLLVSVSVFYSENILLLIFFHIRMTGFRDNMSMLSIC